MKISRAWLRHKNSISANSCHPVLKDFHQWLQANQSRIPKDSLTYDAIRYALNQWPILTGYCEEDGRLYISNALAENAIRPFAVGRRNWLFADTRVEPKPAPPLCQAYLQSRAFFEGLD
ncbi:MAG: transposase [Gammaproteobacteria bacterium]|nr:transposase [Gammaproteobacteria bacterium]